MRLFYLTLLLLSAPVLASEARLICSWTDARGTTHFSTTKTKGATCKEISPSAPIKYDSGKLPSDKLPNRASVASSSAASVPRTRPQAVSNLTTQIAILSPIDEQTVRNNSGDIDVTVMVVPKLTESQTVQLLLDGTPSGSPTRSIQQQLKNIDRGSHQVSAQLLDKGQVVATAPAVTVYLHRASVLNREALNPPIAPK
ncbi:MAG: hypothetical protein ACRCYN_05070 [Plesiomonas sp.]